MLSIVFLIILCLSYSTNAADRQIFPTLLPAIRKAFGYNLKIAGLLSTVFTLGLAVAGIPTGYILDRTSRKAVILIGMVIYSVFTLATIYATGFWDMLIYRAMTGIGEGMQMAGLFAAIGSYFHRKRSFYIGWMIVAYGVGGFLGPRIGARLAQTASSWRVPFVWFAAIGLVMAAIVLLVVPKGFSESKGPATTGRGGRGSHCAHAGKPVEPQRHSGLYRMHHPWLHPVWLYRPVHDLPQRCTEVRAHGGRRRFQLFRPGRVLSFIGGWFGDRFPQRVVIAVAFVFIAVIGYSMYNVATSFGAQSCCVF